VSRGGDAVTWALAKLVGWKSNRRRRRKGTIAATMEKDGGRIVELATMMTRTSRVGRTSMCRHARTRAHAHAHWHSHAYTRRTRARTHTQDARTHRCMHAGAEVLASSMRAGASASKRVLRRSNHQQLINTKARPPIIHHDHTQAHIHTRTHRTRTHTNTHEHTDTHTDTHARTQPHKQTTHEPKPQNTHAHARIRRPTRTSARGTPAGRCRGANHPRPQRH
jgi:hypothetical protein